MCYPMQGLATDGMGGSVPQYFKFLTLCLWVLHGKNRLQTAFVPPPPTTGRVGALDPVDSWFDRLDVLFRGQVV